MWLLCLQAVVPVLDNLECTFHKTGPTFVPQVCVLARSILGSSSILPSRFNLRVQPLASSLGVAAGVEMCHRCVPSHAPSCCVVYCLAQTWFFCITCNFTRENGNKGVCEPCARICHAGHTLSPPMSGGFYCDCGNEKKCKELARVRAGVAAAPAAGTTAAPPCQWRNQAVTRKCVVAPVCVCQLFPLVPLYRVW